MKRSIYLKQALIGALFTCFASTATAEITVDKSQGQLKITSDLNGLLIVKVIGPDDVIIVNDRYQGNSFHWSPTSGPDGAYRYDVRIIEASTDDEKEAYSEYAGGSIEVIDGVIPVIEDESQGEEVQ